MCSPSLWLVFHLLNGVRGRSLGREVLWSDLCVITNRAGLHVENGSQGPRGGVGEAHYGSLAKRWWWSGLRGARKDGEREAAREECMENKTGRAWKHPLWISPEGKLSSANWSIGHHILFVFNSETPINFSVLIIWERWDQMNTRVPSGFHRLWCHEQDFLRLF